MQLSLRQVARLQSIIDTAQKILSDASKAAPAGARTKTASRLGNNGPATRRRGADLVAFRKMIKAERKAGSSVADLAEKLGVTPSYIYQMR